MQQLHSGQFDLAIGLGGIAMALAPAPTGLWPLAWIALIPLWLAVMPDPLVGPTPDSRMKLRAWTKFEWAALKTPLPPGLLKRSAIWGLAYHGLALSWITGLHPLTWMGIPWLGSIAITGFAWGAIALWGVLLIALWGLGLTLLGWLSPGLVHPGIRVLVGTALWCGLESLWAQGPLWWTSLSYTQSPGNLWILHLGQLAGPTAVTAAIVAVNGLLAEAWRSQIKRNQPQTATALAAMALGLWISLESLGYGLYAQPLQQPPSQKFTVGLIQGNVPTRRKFERAGVQQAWEGYVGGYQALADQGVDLVVTPEGALPMLWTPQNRAGNAFQIAVAARHVPALLGTFVADGEGNYTQTLLMLTGQPEPTDQYSKLKLVPLGEYLPFRAVLGQLIGRLSPVQSDLVPGNPQQLLQTPFGSAIASICYESAFAELLRSQTARGGEWLITASNLDPYSQVLMAQHEALDRMRAIESDRWAVRVTNTGYSGVIDPHGRVQFRSMANQYQTPIITAYRRQTQTLYVRWGDWLMWSLLGSSAIALSAIALSSSAL